MPQEIEVWYLIPAIRMNIARILIKKFNKTQKEVAEIFGVTEAAISQYVSSKRGNEIKFNSLEINQIEKVAKKIIVEKNKSSEIIYRLILNLRGSKSMCEFHKKHDKDIPKNCDLCLK